MKVTVEQQPKSSVILDIVADDDEFKQAVNRAFRRVNELVNVPGFRPGKAPRQLVEQRVGRDLIVQEAHREVMDDLYRRALEQEDIVPVSDPEVDVYQDEPVGFKVTIQVYPKVDLGDYSTISVEPREVNATEEEVEDVIQNLRKQQSTWVEPDEPRAPVEGDQVILDFEVYEGDEEFHEPVVGADFVLGEGPLFKQIEEAVKFLQPGADAEFDINFDEDDEEVPEQIRGKTLHYKVKLQEVKSRELPEVDEEFLKSINEEYSTIEDLREAIRKDLLQNKVQQSRDEFLDEAFEKFAELASLEVPDGLVDRELEREYQQLGERLGQQGMSMDEYLRMTQKTESDIQSEMRPDVANRVRNSLVLEAFGEAEGVEVTDEDINAEIETMVGDNEQAEQMKELYQSDYFKNMLRSQLENRKITEHLIEHVSGGVGAITGEGKALLDEQSSSAIAESTEVEGSSDDDSSENADADSDEEQAAEAESAGDGDDEAEQKPGE
ncbi:MAG: trigger factor [Sphaerobacteraceae bacterium]|nr:MAG: trigger factor [Sphaerobacteraceae bacterium]